MMWVSKEFVEDELSENNLNMNESGHAGLINLEEYITKPIIIIKMMN